MRLPEVTPWLERQQAAWISLRRSRTPIQGIFYWIPRRRGGWRLQVWLAQTNHPNDLRHLHHRLVWPEAIEHLCYEWRINVDRGRDALVRHFAALPRGRVGFTPKKYWVIGQGTESRVPREVDRLCRVFRLDSRLVRIFRDDHWDPLPSDEAAIEQLLNGHSRDHA